MVNNEKQKHTLLEQLVRRRLILTRMSTERDLAPLDSPERERLEAACKKAVISLAETASSVLQSDVYWYSNTVNNSADDSLLKWRTRLTRELSSLRCALFHLQDAKHSLSAAITENISYNPRGKSFSIGRHCNTAASHLEKARSVCAYVRREISDQLSNRLQSSRRNIALEAHLIIDEVYRKVHQFENQAIEQLAFLAAAEAEMAVSGTHTATTNNNMNISPSSWEMNMDMEMDTSCIGDSQLPHLKRALCLLMTLA